MWGCHADFLGGRTYAGRRASAAFVVPTLHRPSTTTTISRATVSHQPRHSKKNSLYMISHPDIDNEHKRLLSEQRRWRKATKQLATLGPVSNNAEMIEKLFLAGADVFRLNFSHGKHEEKAALVKIIRELEERYNHPIAILADLQGPKLRVDVFEKDKVRRGMVAMNLLSSV